MLPGPCRALPSENEPDSGLIPTRILLTQVSTRENARQFTYLS